MPNLEGNGNIKSFAKAMVAQCFLRALRSRLAQALLACGFEQGFE
jgi:hypothetical protein